ncbi:Arginine--tRNA ligase [Seminavis robusta]|uniref:arginine--tRNA ligase n=1 Tax=Seminavis robusta TaxID=568900 RepID=A0A9N8DDI9_9STRA|nr:Arginine--tRNA ligase [Seminavis robusta]|eukprot:Sro44_g026590.1 Arginine--tRNA ligase (726) ;mRNA; r:53968-56676
MMMMLWCGVSIRYTAAFSTTKTVMVRPITARILFHQTSSKQSRLFLSTTTSEKVSSSSSSHVSLYGIDWVRTAVVKSLNDLFDPKEVARGNALAKLNKPKKKKKKKKKQQPEEDEQQQPQPEEPTMSKEEKNAIVDAAVAAAKPFSYEDVMVTPATRDDFGDYQCNAAMGLAKAVGMNPRECATKIVERLRPDIQDIMEEPEIAGPGFINLRFKQEYLAAAARAMAQDAQGKLAIPPTSNQKKIVVDYSSPNIAKEMHVGHLRSTIIGDTLCNLLDFCGHDVVRLNHVGDWGTQFGMLVEHLRDEYPAALNKETSQDVDLGDLVMLYKAAKKRFDEDEDFKTRAREGVVKLQAGNAEEIAAWESLCAASRVEYQKIYDVLNIKGLEERGESFYNPLLSGVVEDLEKQELAVESNGAKVVYLEGYEARDGSPLPILVQKSDGGFNYATTDLAAIRQRTTIAASEGGEEADRVLYVTDSGQAQHFDMVFQAARKASFIPDSVSLEHVPFGLVQGEDGKKFATRSGDTVKLKDLLNEAVRIAGDDLKSRNEDSSDAAFAERIDRVATIVGIAAVKYADLSMNRESNYRFSYERMLSLNGNTAPYMLYAYARICGIIRKASGQEGSDGDFEWPEASDVIISHDTELELIRNLVKLPDLINDVEQSLYPHKLCEYLFQTSQKFNQFYGACSVNNADTPELKASRLTLCTATAGTIRLILNLLGIQTVERL